MTQAASSEPIDLVAFDFDGTLTTEDTFVGFMKHLLGPAGFYARMIRPLPVFAAYKLGRVERHATKRAVVEAVFKGRSRDEIEHEAEVYARKTIPTLIRPEGLETFQARWDAMQAGGPRVVVCSASISPYLRAFFSDFQDLDIVACELAYDTQDQCTGQLRGYNVWGENKVRALRERYAPRDLRILEAYGDTQGDVPMLDLAQESHWRPFR